MPRQYNAQRKEGETTSQWYRRLAKVADQRLVELEKLSKNNNYKAVEKYAYSRALRDIKQWSGENAKRFNTKPPENGSQLRAKINDIIDFINAPTSTKTGITNIYKQRADTLNKNHGTNFTWQELANFFESEQAQKISNRFADSSVMIKAIGTIKKHRNDEELIEAIKESNKTNLKLSDDSVVDSISKQLIRDGLTYDDLF